MRNTIFASFSDPKMAEKAAGALLDHGLRSEDLSIIQSHKWRTASAEEVAAPQTPTMVYISPNASGQSTGVSPFGVMPMVTMVDGVTPQVERFEDLPNFEELAKHGISTTTTEDAGAGALSGLPWGVGLGTIAAIASLFVPGFGLVIGGGALATAIIGIAASAGAGAAAGALTGYLKDQGVPSHLVAEYEGTINAGGAILGATIPSGDVDESCAWEVLNKYAGTHVTSYINKPYVS